MDSIRMGISLRIRNQIAFNCYGLQKRILIAPNTSSQSCGRMQKLSPKTCNAISECRQKILLPAQFRERNPKIPQTIPLRSIECYTKPDSCWLQFNSVRICHYLVTSKVAWQDNHETFLFSCACCQELFMQSRTPGANCTRKILLWGKESQNSSDNSIWVIRVFTQNLTVAGFSSVRSCHYLVTSRVAWRENHKTFFFLLMLSGVVYAMPDSGSKLRNEFGRVESRMTFADVPQ
ncbi:hypothetical protein CEXT_368681 [Caerostris extrusa]|uniref:Uncharacterized protein n=1 Tax=Caerostris extrusa TaxID=172846 RepID=A0AAV4PC14_CAEEX|nr:hypothetical protein CEXT_368681 [Caerostris extrusa]